MDVDGTITDGKIYIGPKGYESLFRKGLLCFQNAGDGASRVSSVMM